jgi:hypothetical protein
MEDNIILNFTKVDFTTQNIVILSQNWRFFDNEQSTLLIARLK